MVHLKNVARDVETGDPFTTGNAEIRGPDGAVLASPAVNATTGFWEYQANGQPGITEQEYTASGQTKIVSGDAFGQARSVNEAEIERILRLFGDGVITGMAVTAPGGMAVTVGLGDLLNLGVLHPIYTAENVTIGASDPTNPRIDVVVSRLTRTSTFAGRVVLAVVAGTPAATPAVPAITDTADTHDVEVARVTVPAAAAAIVTGNINTTVRPLATGPIPVGGWDTDDLADGAVTSVKTADFDIDAPVAGEILRHDGTNFVNQDPVPSRATFLTSYTAVQWFNMPAALTRWASLTDALLQTLDLSTAVEFRLLTYVNPAANAGAELRAIHQESGGGATGSDLAATAGLGDVALNVAGECIGAWTPIAAAARIANAGIGICGVGGDGASDPGFYYIALEYR